VLDEAGFQIFDFPLQGLGLVLADGSLGIHCLLPLLGERLGVRCLLQGICQLPLGRLARFPGLVEPGFQRRVVAAEVLELELSIPQGVLQRLFGLGMFAGGRLLPIQLVGLLAEG
jgi:hypothetical protein